MAHTNGLGSLIGGIIAIDLVSSVISRRRRYGYRRRRRYSRPYLWDWGW